MTKPAIHSLEELEQEKIRLKHDIKYRKASIRTSVKDIKNELNPFNHLSGTAKSVLMPAKDSPLVSMGISAAANFLLKKVVFKRMGFIPRLILPMVVNKASNYISAPALNDKLTGKMHLAASSLRDADVADIVDVPAKKIADATGHIGDKIADTLHTAAIKVREPKPLPALRIKGIDKAAEAVADAGYTVAEKLHGAADRLRVTVQTQSSYAAQQSAKKVAGTLRGLAGTLRNTSYKVR